MTWESDEIINSLAMAIDLSSLTVIVAFDRTLIDRRRGCQLAKLEL
jgi:hypothetical protein